MYESSTKETSGCASNLLAHEDLGHLRRPIVGIYKPSSIMKIPTSIWKWQNKRLSIMKITVLLWSTSVAKDSNIVPSLFSLIFYMAFLFFYIPHLGQCSRKWWSSHFYLFTTQWLQLDTRTKYDSKWMSPTVYWDMRWTKSDMYERIMNGGFSTNTISTTWSC